MNSPIAKLAICSLALDYEKDPFNTPRISAVADARDGSGWLCVVREDGIEVRRMPLETGRFYYVATYEEHGLNAGQSGAFTAENAAAACSFMLGEGVFAQRTNPVTAVAAVEGETAFSLHAKDAETTR